MSNEQTKDLKALAQNKDGNTYLYKQVDKTLLESFPSPQSLNNPYGNTGTLHIEVPEFTSLCPLTGQPDFAKIIIDYQPIDKCVESKSLKLYMASFRNQGEFHESCVQRMVNDLVELLDPQWLVIEGQFTPRGGIPFWPSVTYDKK